MIRVILLDLDNTLLINPDLEYAGAFLTALEQFLRREYAVDGAGAAFRQALKQSTRSAQFKQSLYTRLIANLSHQTGIGEFPWAKALDHFFQVEHPKLAVHGQAITQAQPILNRLHSTGYTLVIATNPLYPEIAIQERLTWAGLADIPFALISHAENMHYCKPDSAYYAEIIARIGAEPDEALMVGDNLEKDILPAQRIGLHTAWISTGTNQGKSTKNEADWAGSLSSFEEFIHHSEWPLFFATKPLRPEMIEPQFYGNLGALYGLLENTQPHQWAQNPIEDEWSILQILCHLWESEHSHQRQRLERILHEDNPFIAAPRAPGPTLPLCTEDAWQVAEQFAHERAQTIDLLRRLAPEDWQRPARHSIFGLTTLLEMAQFTAQHDRLHLNQLCQTIGRCI